MGEYFTDISKLLKYFGNIRLKEPTTFFSKLYALIILSASIFQEIAHLSYLYWNINDFEKILETFPDIILFLISSIQYIIVLFYSKEWKDLLNHLENVIINDQILYNEKEYNKNWFTKVAEKKNVERNLIIIIFTSSLMWWITAYINGSLPFKNVCYPFDHKKYYYPTLIFQVLNNIMSLGNMSLMRILGFKTCFKIIDLLRIFKHSLSNILENSEINEKRYLQKLNKLARFHDVILR